MTGATGATGATVMAAAPALPTPRPAEAGIHVVLVEDNSADALLTRSMLHKAGLGVSVTVVERLAGLADVLAATPAGVDCVLLDLSLPDSHGLETVSRARALAGQTPIVVLTGDGDDAMGLTALRHGAHDFLVKDELTPRVLGRSLRYARERAASEAALVAREQFATTVLDSLAAATAVVDAHGRIVRVNQPWREYAERHGGSDVRCGVGIDYLAVCDAAGDDFHAVAAAAAIRSVLCGEQPAATVEYPVTGPDAAEEWYALRVTALADGQGAVASHLRITDEVLARQALEHAAVRDPLTGLANRTLLEEQLAKAVASIGRTVDGVALFFIDVDHFKAVNDTLGHCVGDDVLAHVARRLESAVRTSDIVARVGGDEFVVLCGNAATAAEVDTIRRRIADALKAPVVTPRAEHPIAVAASIGHTVCTSSDTDPAALMASADSAMYAVKLAGRQPEPAAAVGAEQPAEHGAARQQQLRRALVAALANGELDVHYQPEWSHDGAAITGVEALARWTDPTLGPVAPTEFVAVAEVGGLIDALGGYVLRRACADAAQWAAAGMPLPVAVNVSPLQLQDAGFAGRVAAVLSDTGLDPTLLVLEITENALVVAWDVAAATLGALRALGVRTALDDFGTGHATLTLLRSCSFDVMKIDRTFVADLNTSRGEAVLTAMVALGHALGLQVVAEGVEDARHQRQLGALGCDTLQGFHLARPMPHPQFCELLTQAPASVA